MNNIVKKIIKLFNREDRFTILASRGFYNHISDEKYLKKMFKLRMGYNLNLDNPKTFNEKIQWIKLYDRKNIYTKMADKYEAKIVVSKMINEEYIIPTIGIYDKFDDIDFDSLPNQFVIKCTHDSGGVVIVKNKNELDKDVVKKKINKCFKNNYYYFGREWVYKNIKPRIIIEKYLPNLKYDYRFYCFNGQPKYIYVYTEKDEGINKPEPEYCNIYDVNWKKAEFHQKSMASNEIIKTPKNYEKMIEIAKKIAKNTYFLRVDFYEWEDNLFFSELTFYPGSGFSPFYPSKWDKKLGDLINLDFYGEDDK